jgi:CubicO group peptidase (beta-lactamase class C family)
MASNTKSFTAVMLMQLRDAGRLQLDDPVNRYVPAVVYQAPDGRLVSPTFRQLAAHISGLPRDMRPAPASVEQLFQRLPQVVAESDPGTEYLYSNLGYAVLGQALAVIAGQPYAQYVTEHILRPLGMSSSGFDRSAIQAPIATGYTSIEVTPEGVTAQPARYASLGPGNPSGGLLSSLADMTQFVKLQFADGPVGGSQILSGASLREMWEPVFPTNGPGSATVGWFVSPFGSQALVCKNGALPGFHTQVCFLPQSQVGVVILANVATRLLTGPAGLQRMAQMILTTVLPALSPPATSS